MNYFNVNADKTACISQKATILGSVNIGPNCSIHAGAQIRGDVEEIILGSKTNVQENAVLHVDENFPLTTGEGVTIGHSAIVHGCTLEDYVMVGMGAIVMNGAHIGKESLIGAGALVTQGKEFPPRSLLMGTPAKLVRELSDEEFEEQQVRAANWYANVGKDMVESGVMFHPDIDFKGQN